MTDRQGHIVFSDELIIKFEGDNAIDVRQLFGYVLGIEEAYQANISMQYRHPEIQLKVVAINQGSFEIILQSAVALVPDLITKLPQSITFFKEVMEMIKLKRELRGKKPEKVEKEDETAKVVNADGNVSYHNCKIVNNYFNSPQIDVGLAKAFCALDMGNERKTAVNMTSAQETVRIEEQEYSQISAPIIAESIDQDRQSTKITNTELRIAKLDFIGDTMWSFVNKDGKTIRATIEDADFDTKVKSGRIKLSANDRLTVRLRSKIDFDEFGKSKRKYFIEQVYMQKNTGDVNQLQLNIDDFI